MNRTQDIQTRTDYCCTEAIILAGGMGTRLKSEIQDVPKPMAEINGKPFIEYLIRYLKNNGITHVILSVGYKAEIIENHFGNSFDGIAISYSHETTPLGTGGGVLLAMQQAKTENIVLVNGDTLFDVPLKELAGFHTQNNATVSIALKKIDDTTRYGTIEIDKNGRITAFREKTGGHGGGLISGGTYIISKKKFLEFELPSRFSLEKDFLEKFYEKEYFWGLEFNGYFIDIGTPMAYRQAQTDFLNIT